MTINMRRARTALSLVTLCIFSAAVCAAMLWPSHLTDMLLIAAFGFLFAVWTIQTIVPGLRPDLRFPRIRPPR